MILSKVEKQELTNLVDEAKNWEMKKLVNSLNLGDFAFLMGQIPLNFSSLEKMRDIKKIIS